MPLTGSQKALMYCQSGVERCGATRSGYHSAFVFISIGGTQVAYAKANSAYAVEMETLTITDQLDERPNTCDFLISGFTPTKGQEVIITLGSKNTLDRIFAGFILQITQQQVVAGSKVFYQVSCIDYTWLLNFRKVTKRYTNQSATAIAQDLISTYAPAFTSRAVQSGLALVDEIGFDNSELASALTELAKRAGGYWYVDYLKDLHFWTGTESGVTHPVNLTTAHTSLTEFGPTTDLGQTLTRVCVEGGGSPAAQDVAVGATTLPVDSGSWYAPAGGTVVSGPQRITYTGVTTSVSAAPAAPTAAKAYYDASGVKTINGTPTTDGLSPSTITVSTTTVHGFSAGQAVVITGADVGVTGPVLIGTVPTASSFTFQRAVLATILTAGGSVRASLGITSMQTRAGVCTVTTSAAHGLVVGQVAQILETGGVSNVSFAGPQTVVSVPSTTTFTFSLGGYPADSVAFPFGAPATLHAAALAASSGPLIGTYLYKDSYATGGTETFASVASSSVTVAAVTNLDMNTSATSTTGGSMSAGTYGYAITGTTAEGETTPGTIQSAILTGGNTALSLTVLNAYLNDPRIRGLNIWRTTNGAAQTLANLKYAGSVTLNLTTGGTMTFLDTRADASLGAPAPTTNTTGGAVVLSALGVSSDGRTSARNIYRTAAGGSTYKQIVTATGNVTTTAIDVVSDASRVNGVDEPTTANTPATLTGIPASGVGSIQYAIAAGDAVNVLATVNDAAAQAVLAALVGGDGVVEDYQRDTTLTLADATDRATATLTLRSASESGIKFKSRDKNTRAGRTITVSFGSPTSVSGAYKLQQVTISQFSGNATLFPTYEANGSTTLFSFDDLLRAIQKGRN